MDILIHLTILVIIGVFFFLDKHSTSYNSMFFIIVISLFGFLLVLNDNIEIVDYTTNIQVNSTHLINPSTEVDNVGFGLVNVQSFIVLSYWFFLILAFLNIVYGKEKKGGYKDD